MVVEKFRDHAARKTGPLGPGGGIKKTRRIAALSLPDSPLDAVRVIKYDWSVRHAVYALPELDGILSGKHVPLPDPVEGHVLVVPRMDMQN